MDLSTLETRARALAAFYSGAAHVPEAKLLPLARQLAWLEAMHADALREASTDALTGLGTRGAILARLEEAVSRAQRYDVPLAVLLLDLDHFKRVNDKHGHLAGDEALRAVGVVVRQALRTTDAAGRYGGEELLVVAEATEPAVLGERIRSGVEALAFTDERGECFQVTCSVGIARWAGPLCGRDLVGAADRALYWAKETGRNKVRLARR